MPVRKPRCPKCGAWKGNIKFVRMVEVNHHLSTDFVEYGKVLYRCKYCGHEYTDFGQHNINTASQLLAKRKREEK
jgi:uncharacterized protein with PIN domain